jgi:6-phosphogluconolactonase
MRQPQVRIFDDPQAVAVAARDYWVQRQAACGDAFWISLAGGSTPKELYRLIAQQNLAWENMHLIWGDERFVSHDHPDSNYKMVRDAWLNHVSPPAEQVRPWTIMADAKSSAQDYDQWLRQQRPDGVDLCLLGMGDDGHTASLFPGTAALEEKQHLAVANYVEKFQSERLTLTYPYLALSREVLFLVTGAAKAGPLREVIKEGKHPAAQVTAREAVWFYVDKAAAANL